MARILGFHCRGLGSIPGWGTESLQTAGWPKKKKKSLGWGEGLKVFILNKALLAVSQRATGLCFSFLDINVHHLYARGCLFVY